MEKKLHLLGGKIVLIRSTLSNLPTYYLFIFNSPNKVIKSIMEMQRNFLLEPGDIRKDHMLKLNNICKPVEMGGLGLSNSMIQNETLLAKWIWRFPSRNWKSLALGFINKIWISC